MKIEEVEENVDYRGLYLISEGSDRYGVDSKEFWIENNNKVSK